MKTLFYSVLLAIAFVSCRTEEKVNYAVIQGKIDHKLSNKLNVNSLMNSFRKEIKLNEDGTFIDTLHLESDNLMIYDGRNLTYIYIEKGNNISLTYDTDDVKKTINFTGKGSEINNYLVSKRNTETEITKSTENIYMLGEQDYLSKQKEIESAVLNLLNSTPNLPSDYVKNEKKNIKYRYLSNLNNYESYHAHYTKNPDFKVSDGFLKELEGLDLNNETDFSFSYNYNVLVSIFCKKEAEKLSKKLGIERDVAALETINKLISNQNIKNSLLYKDAKSGISFTSNLEAYYNAFMRGSTNEEHNAEITKSYNELKTVAKGSSSPKFVNYENIAGGTTSLDDLKGKYVYIDVWATWCGPCKAEIPFLKEVEKEYHGKNIVFVSISVDQAKNRDKWKKMVADENLGGIQLMADNDFKSQFVQDYFIKGIPKFILLDPNGDIVTPNAPRPSDKKLIDLFNQLNI